MKKNKVIIAFIFIGLVLISFICCQFYKEFKYQEKMTNHYNDYNRASIIFALSFYKNFDDFYNNIRHQQRYNEDIKETKNSIITDLKEYNIIDVLKYANNVTNDDNFINSFNNFFLFLENFNCVYNKTGEDMLIANKLGKYYTKKGNEYIYKINKKIITKNSFQKLFSNYLNYNGYNMDTYFYVMLWNNKEINEYYTIRNLSYSNMVNDIRGDYTNFYTKFKEVILSEITGTLNDFGKYLMNGVVTNDDKLLITFKLDVNEIELTYKFTKVQNIYNDVSVYSTELYKLDINDVWKQLKDIGLPKAFM